MARPIARQQLLGLATAAAGVPASLDQYLPSAINITLDREAATGEIGDAAIGGHVAFVLSKKNSTSNFVSYVVVMDLFGNITRFEPIYDYASGSSYHGLALKLKNSSTIMMAVSLARTTFNDTRSCMPH